MPKLKITLTQKWNKRTKEIEVQNNGKELGSVYNGFHPNLTSRMEAIRSL